MPDPRVEMTGRQRLLTVLRGGIPDRMPFVPLVNAYFWSTLPPEWDIDSPADCCRRIGADIAERWVPSVSGSSWDDPEVLSAGHIVRREHREAGRVWVEYETPVGSLSMQFCETSEAGQTAFRGEHLVKTAADLRAYQYLWEAKAPAPAYHLTQERLDEIGEDGMAWLHVPCTPLLHLIMYDLGLERTAYLLADEPEAMQRLLDVMAGKNLTACKIAADSPAEVGIVAENSGTRLVSPAQFAAHCAPVLAEYARIFHSRGKILLLHACGHLRGLLPQIAATGIDGIESLTPPPTGNVDLAYARQVVGRDMTIIGGMDPVWFLKATPAEVEHRVEEIAELIYPGDHFMLMPSDSTPAHTPLANFEAVRRAIARKGRWTGKA